jgi:hypothetical protein
MVAKEGDSKSFASISTRVRKPLISRIRATIASEKLAPTESYQPWLEVESKATPETVAEPPEHGFGDDGTESTRPRQSGLRRDQTNEYDSEVSHPGNGINTSKTSALRPWP